MPIEPIKQTSEEESAHEEDKPPEEAKSENQEEESAIALGDWLTPEAMVECLQEKGVKIEKIKSLSDAAGRGELTTEGDQEFSDQGVKLHRAKIKPKESKYRIVG
jgi:hypothetical protein